MIGGEIEIMKNLYFDDFEDLACDIADKFDMVKDDFDDIAIIAKYEEAKEIISELVCIGYSLESIRMSRPEWKNYHEEYLISLNNDGIWCEEMKSDGKYLPDESTITYILDNCSSKVIPHCKGKIVYEVTVGIDEDDCDCSECACKKDGKPATSTTTKSTYKINNKEVSKEEFDKKYEEFEEMYLDNIRDMLLNYCEFMDEVNEWRKLLRW
mgnify:CR=1 FL=1